MAKSKKSSKPVVAAQTSYIATLKPNTNPPAPSGPDLAEVNRIAKLLSGVKGLAGKVEVADLEDIRNVECYSTGHPAIDDLLTGIVDDKSNKITKGSGRGAPRGRMIEIFGPESVSKTTLILCIIAEAQKRGAVCAFIDAEHALDLNYAHRLGVQIDKLLVVTPDTGEQALEAAQKLAAEVDLLALDSFDAMTPEAVLAGAEGMGVQPRLISRFCRTVTAIAGKPRAHSGQGCLVLCTNQIRNKVGMIFGSNETTTGGNGPKFYASIRVDLRRDSQPLKDPSGQPIGIRVTAKTVKNKVSPPFRNVTFDVIWNKGIKVPSKEQVEKERAERKAAWEAKKKKKK